MSNTSLNRPLTPLPVGARNGSTRRGSNVRGALQTFVIAIAIALAGCSSSKDPLSLQVPTGWTIEHSRPGGLHFYTMTPGSPQSGLLMFSQWPPPSRPEDIPKLVQQLADGFLKEAHNSSELKLVTEEYRVEQFAGPQCHGSYAAFQTSYGGTNVLQTMFIMSVDDKIWNGQF